MSARAEPLVWLVGLCLAVCAGLIVWLLASVVFHGSRAFWPAPIDRVTLRNGETLLGVPTDVQAFDAGPPLQREIDELRATGVSFLKDSFDQDGRPIRVLYRVGNREMLADGVPPFRWVDRFRMTEITRPKGVVFVERRNDWGPFIGEAKALISQRTILVPKGEPEPAAQESIETPTGLRRAERTRIAEEADGSTSWREMVYLAEGADVLDALDRMLPEAQARYTKEKSLNEHGLGSINRKLNAIQMDLRQTEIELSRVDQSRSRLGWPLWSLIVVVAIGAAAAGWTLDRRSLSAGSVRGPRLRAAARAIGIAAVIAALAAILERPWAGAGLTPQALTEMRSLAAERKEELSKSYGTIQDDVRELREIDHSIRIELVDSASGRFAPVSQSNGDERAYLSQVVRVVPANDLSFLGKLAVYGARWREYLFDPPRNTNTEGGIFPVIFGTVVMTLLLSIIVVPLGVVAALYLREYAKQGMLTSIVRIAVNNLAGVPSIVYGVFGMGFFLYTVGKYVDYGPETSNVLPRGNWWLLAVGAVVLAFLALLAGVLARATPGKDASRLNKACAFVTGALWIGAVAAAIGLLMTTPYFHGFFEASAPSPTFGTRGILWASLTLSLLTLPVVIVATEEAIAAVPRSMREGSMGCGASKWQTLRRIVLPGAMPGIMTGMILAMARGAGEVAPLMLVGAVKLNAELPFSAELPFVHLDRSFMHLGFHIYDLGFQSPDSQAAQPLVWTTTLLLILVVLVLNLAAITIRARLRSRLTSGVF